MDALAYDPTRRWGLVADIGGTNARFALASLEGPLGLTAPVAFRVADFPDIAAAIRAFLDRAGASAPRTGLLAVAAAPDGDRVALTNAPWRFSLPETARALGLSQLFAVNDFAANAWALPHLAANQVIAVGPHGLPALAGTAAILGPGTGLGVGAVHRDASGRTIVLETEGGHIDYAPVDETEEKVFRDLRARFGRVSYERLLCGEGLVNIHRALTGGAAPVAPEAITGRAASDPEAARSVRLFCEVLGSFAGNAALMLGAWNAIFLAGGLVAAVADELMAGGFRRRFEAKGRFAPTVAGIPTLIVAEPWLGLLGAAAALRARAGPE